MEFVPGLGKEAQTQTFQLQNKCVWKGMVEIITTTTEMQIKDWLECQVKLHRKGLNIRYIRSKISTLEVLEKFPAVGE